MNLLKIFPLLLWTILAISTSRIVAEDVVDDELLPPPPGPNSVPLESPSAFLTAALSTLYGPNQAVVFIGPNVSNIFAGSDNVLQGDLHGGFRFHLDGPSPDPKKVTSLLRVFDYVIYNHDGKLQHIYGDVNPDKSGWGLISSLYPWTVRAKFDGKREEISNDLADPNFEVYGFYQKYLPIFLPLSVELHSNLIIPPKAGHHGPLFNEEELFVRSKGSIYNFPLNNAPFRASGAKFVEAETGKLDLTVLPGWALTVTSTNGPLPKLSVDVVEAQYNQPQPTPLRAF